MELEPPAIIGLAKREETIVFPDERSELKLDFRDPALRLLQRARDEAHRFANQFNADLRSKKFGNLCWMILPVWEKSSRSTFRTFWKLGKNEKASVEKIQMVEGSGQKLAERLHLFLHSGKQHDEAKFNYFIWIYFFS